MMNIINAHWPNSIERCAVPGNNPFG